jgi:hypothetical protein
MKHKVKVVMLLTENKTGAIYTEGDGVDAHRLTCKDMEFNKLYKPQHLYATVSQDVEAIKVNDWTYDHIDNVLFSIGNSHRLELAKRYEYRKIIATTDLKLKQYTCHTPTDCGQWMLPQLQQSFLKEYVVNPEGEYEVEYGPEFCWVCKDTLVNSINCEGHELVIELNQNNTVNITSVEKKMYRSEDMVEGFIKGFNIGLKSENTNDFNKALKDWIKENL